MELIENSRLAWFLIKSPHPKVNKLPKWMKRLCIFENAIFVSAALLGKDEQRVIELLSKTDIRAIKRGVHLYFDLGASKLESDAVDKITEFVRKGLPNRQNIRHAEMVRMANMGMGGPGIQGMDG